MPSARYFCIFINVGLGEGSALPVGVPVPWPSATPPTGWLKCNGAAFSAEDYPNLAKAYPEETTRSPLKQVPTLVSADDVTAQLLLRSPRSGIFAPPRLSGSYQQTPLCWGVASTCSRWAEKAGSASYFQAPLM